MWFHFAHCDRILVKTGDKVKRGQKIAVLGKSGTGSPHLHFEVWKQDPKIRGYNSYTEGLSKTKVQQIYDNPDKYRTAMNPTKFDHYGYHFLDSVYDAKGHFVAYHPGVDLNGPGQDLGQDIVAPSDGVVVWIGLNVRGWGNHFYILKEDAPTPPPVDNSMIYIKDFSEGDFNKMMDLFFLKGNYSYTGPKNKEEWLTAYGNLNFWQFLEKGYQHSARKNFTGKLEKSFETGKQLPRNDFYNTNIKP